MSKKAKRVRPRTYTDLVEMAAIDEAARHALDRYYAIKKASRMPEILYSDFGGRRIVDALASRSR